MNASTTDLSRIAPTSPSNRLSIWSVLRKIHQCERGSVSLETVLMLAAVAIPILIILLKFGWPKIKDYFDDGMKRLPQETDNMIQNG